jgi:hypothetical protein
LITSAPVNHGSQTTSTDFCNKIGPSRHSRLGRETVAIGEKQTLIFTGAEPLGTD